MENSAHSLAPSIPIRNWKMGRVKAVLIAAVLCGLPLELSVAQELRPGSDVQIWNAGRLELHKPVKREIAGGSADVFHINLKAGEFVHVVARQEGIDVVLAILDPKGREAVSTDSPNGDFGPEPASTIAADTGTYDVRVAAKSGHALSGKYRLEVMELRAPTAEDRLRLQAEELFRSAVADDRAA